MLDKRRAYLEMGRRRERHRDCLTLIGVVMHDSRQKPLVARRVEARQSQSEDHVLGRDNLVNGPTDIGAGGDAADGGAPGCQIVRQLYGRLGDALFVGYQLWKPGRRISEVFAHFWLDLVRAA